MVEPKLEVPAELRDLAEKTIDQAEKAFGMFFDAANKSMTSIPSPGTRISKQALTFTEQNIKAAFEHARKLVHATDLQQAMQIQSEFLKANLNTRYARGLAPCERLIRRQIYVALLNLPGVIQARFSNKEPIWPRRKQSDVHGLHRMCAS
jgi:phasin